MRHILVGFFALVVMVPNLTAQPDDSGLGLADLPGYRSALQKEPGGEAVPVRFRDIWKHPEDFKGRFVRVEGRVARRFRQEALGAFPPLTELWVFEPSGDPLCLVFPTDESSMQASTKPGTSVRFEGTFLRLVRYSGADTPRLAPLIVGASTPQVLSEPRRISERSGSWVSLEWLLGLGLAAVVVTILAAQHARMPRRPSERVGDGLPPEFLNMDQGEKGSEHIDAQS